MKVQPLEREKSKRKLKLVITELQFKNLVNNVKLLYEQDGSNKALLINAPLKSQLR